MKKSQCILWARKYGMCKLQVYDFLLYISHKQPDDGYCVADTCSCFYNCYSMVVCWQATFLPYYVF